MKRIYLILIISFLSGCATQMDLMPRDSGKIYSGTITHTGIGSVSISIPIEGQTYKGIGVHTGSDDSFGFFQVYGKGKSVTGSSQTFGGNHTAKAILSSPDNHGIRCDVIGDGQGHGSAICLDDNGRIYDAIIH